MYIVIRKTDFELNLTEDNTLKMLYYSYHISAYQGTYNIYTNKQNTYYNDHINIIQNNVTFYI